MNLSKHVGSTPLSRQGVGLSRFPSAGATASTRSLLTPAPGVGGIRTFLNDDENEHGNIPTTSRASPSRSFPRQGVKTDKNIVNRPNATASSTYPPKPVTNSPSSVSPTTTFSSSPIEASTFTSFPHSSQTISQFDDEDRLELASLPSSVNSINGIGMGTPMSQFDAESHVRYFTGGANANTAGGDIFDPEFRSTYKDYNVQRFESLMGRGWERAESSELKAAKRVYGRSLNTDGFLPSSIPGFIASGEFGDGNDLSQPTQSLLDPLTKRAKKMAELAIDDMPSVKFLDTSLRTELRTKLLQGVEAMGPKHRADGTPSAFSRPPPSTSSSTTAAAAHSESMSSTLLPRFAPEDVDEIVALLDTIALSRGRAIAASASDGVLRWRLQDLPLSTLFESAIFIAYRSSMPELAMLLFNRMRLVHFLIPSAETYNLVIREHIIDPDALHETTKEMPVLSASTFPLSSLPREASLAGLFPSHERDDYIFAAGRSLSAHNTFLRSLTHTTNMTDAANATNGLPTNAEDPPFNAAGLAARATMENLGLSPEDFLAGLYDDPSVRVSVSSTSTMSPSNTSSSSRGMGTFKRTPEPSSEPLPSDFEVYMRAHKGAGTAREELSPHLLASMTVTAPAWTNFLFSQERALMQTYTRGMEAADMGTQLGYDPMTENLPASMDTPSFLNLECNSHPANAAANLSGRDLNPEEVPADAPLAMHFATPSMTTTFDEYSQRVRAVAEAEAEAEAEAGAEAEAKAETGKEHGISPYRITPFPLLNHVLNLPGLPSTPFVTDQLPAGYETAQMETLFAWRLVLARALREGLTLPSHVLHYAALLFEMQKLGLDSSANLLTNLLVDELARVRIPVAHEVLYALVNSHATPRFVVELAGSGYSFEADDDLFSELGGRVTPTSLRTVLAPRILTQVSGDDGLRFSEDNELDAMFKRANGILPQTEKEKTNEGQRSKNSAQRSVLMASVRAVRSILGNADDDTSTTLVRSFPMQDWRYSVSISNCAPSLAMFKALAVLFVHHGLTQRALRLLETMHNYSIAGGVSSVEMNKLYGDAADNQVLRDVLGRASIAHLLDEELLRQASANTGQIESAEDLQRRGDIVCAALESSASLEDAKDRLVSLGFAEGFIAELLERVSEATAAVFQNQTTEEENITGEDGETVRSSMTLEEIQAQDDALTNVATSALSSRLRKPESSTKDVVSLGSELDSRSRAVKEVFGPDLDSVSTSMTPLDIVSASVSMTDALPNSASLTGRMRDRLEHEARSRLTASLSATGREVSSSSTKEFSDSPQALLAREFASIRLISSQHSARTPVTQSEVTNEPFDPDVLLAYQTLAIQRSRQRIYGSSPFSAFVHRFEALVRAFRPNPSATPAALYRESVGLLRSAIRDAGGVLSATTTGTISGSFKDTLEALQDTGNPESLPQSKGREGMALFGDGDDEGDGGAEGVAEYNDEAASTTSPSTVNQAKMAAVVRSVASQVSNASVSMLTSEDVKALQEVASGAAELEKEALEAELGLNTHATAESLQEAEAARVERAVEHIERKINTVSALMSREAFSGAAYVDHSLVMSSDPVHLTLPEPDVMMYDLVMKALAKEGRYLEAVRVLLRALYRGRILSLPTMGMAHLAMQCLQRIRGQQWPVGLSILDKMRALNPTHPTLMFLTIEAALLCTKTPSIETEAAAFKCIELLVEARRVEQSELSHRLVSGLDASGRLEVGQFTTDLFGNILPYRLPPKTLELDLQKAFAQSGDASSSRRARAEATRAFLAKLNTDVSLQPSTRDRYMRLLYAMSPAFGYDDYNTDVMTLSNQRIPHRLFRHVLNACVSPVVALRVVDRMRTLGVSIRLDHVDILSRLCATTDQPHILRRFETIAEENNVDVESNILDTLRVYGDRGDIDGAMALYRRVMKELNNHGHKVSLAFFQDSARSTRTVDGLTYIDDLRGLGAIASLTTPTEDGKTAIRTDILVRALKEAADHPEFYLHLMRACMGAESVDLYTAKYLIREALFRNMAHMTAFWETYVRGLLRVKEVPRAVAVINFLVTEGVFTPPEAELSPQFQRYMEEMYENSKGLRQITLYRKDERVTDTGLLKKHMYNSHVPDFIQPEKVEMPKNRFTEWYHNNLSAYTYNFQTGQIAADAFSDTSMAWKDFSLLPIKINPGHSATLRSAYDGLGSQVEAFPAASVLPVNQFTSIFSALHHERFQATNFAPSALDRFSPSSIESSESRRRFMLNAASRAYEDLCFLRKDAIRGRVLVAYQRNTRQFIRSVRLRLAAELPEQTNRPLALADINPQTLSPAQPLGRVVEELEPDMMRVDLPHPTQWLLARALEGMGSMGLNEHVKGLLRVLQVRSRTYSVAEHTLREHSPGQADPLSLTRVVPAHYPLVPTRSAQEVARGFPASIRNPNAMAEENVIHGVIQNSVGVTKSETKYWCYPSGIAVPEATALWEGVNDRDVLPYHDILFTAALGGLRKGGYISASNELFRDALMCGALPSPFGPDGLTIDISQYTQIFPATAVAMASLEILGRACAEEIANRRFAYALDTLPVIRTAPEGSDSLDDLLVEGVCHSLEHSFLPSFRFTVIDQALFSDPSELLRLSSQAGVQLRLGDLVMEPRSARVFYSDLVPLRDALPSVATPRENQGTFTYPILRNDTERRRFFQADKGELVASSLSPIRDFFGAEPIAYEAIRRFRFEPRPDPLDVFMFRRKFLREESSTLYANRFRDGLVRTFFCIVNKQARVYKASGTAFRKERRMLQVLGLLPPQNMGKGYLFRPELLASDPPMFPDTYSGSERVSNQGRVMFDSVAAKQEENNSKGKHSKFIREKRDNDIRTSPTSQLKDDPLPYLGMTLNPLLFTAMTGTRPEDALAATTASGASGDERVHPLTELVFEDSKSSRLVPQSYGRTPKRLQGQDDRSILRELKYTNDVNKYDVKNRLFLNFFERNRERKASLYQNAKVFNSTDMLKRFEAIRHGTPPNDPSLFSIDSSEYRKQQKSAPKFQAVDTSSVLSAGVLGAPSRVVTGSAQAQIRAQAQFQAESQKKEDEKGAIEPKRETKKKPKTAAQLEALAQLEANTKAKAELQAKLAEIRAAAMAAASVSNAAKKAAVEAAEVVTKMKQSASE